MAEASRLLERQVRKLYDRIRKTVKFPRSMLDDLESEFAREKGDPFISGKDNLLQNPGFARRTDRMQELPGTLKQRKAFRKLLDNRQDVQDVSIFIGNGSGMASFDDLSLVSIPLDQGDTPLGIIGMIGPKWMKYDEAIPLVRVTASLASDSLRQIQQEYE